MSEFRSYTTEEAKVSETKSENFLEKFLKGSRREIALGLGALIISLSGSAIAKERHEEDAYPPRGPERPFQPFLPGAVLCAQ